MAKQIIEQLYRVYWIEPNLMADGTLPTAGDMRLPLGYTDAKVYRNLNIEQVEEVKAQRGKNTLIRIYPEKIANDRKRIALSDNREQWVKELDRQFEIQ